MSDHAKQIWNRLKAETTAELSRLGTQGSMEIASALFNGSAFVPYGPGQYTPSIENQEHQQEQELERE